MRIDAPLAQSIAHLAIAEPYRQQNPMTTAEYAMWLKDRGIDVRWETIHHLWSLGLLHPVAVLEPAASLCPDAAERLIPVELQARERTFVDLGVEAGEEIILTPPETLPEELAEALLWHPFQLQSFSWLATLLRIDMTPDSSLYDPETCAKGIGSLIENIHERIIALRSNDLEHQFLRVLALLLGAEPLVHFSLDTNITFHPRAGESFEGYFRWRDAQDGTRLLSEVQLTVDEVAMWHQRLSRDAHHRDPLMFMRELLRHAEPGKRALFRRDALLANDLYDTAEVLRRYLEHYHANALAMRPHPLPEEDTVGFVQTVEEARQLNEFAVGAPRTADFNRGILRRMLRQYHLDPQPRLTWFVEGESEEAFIRHYAALRHIDLEVAGIEVMNVKGVGGVKPERFRPLLERLQREECFVAVTIDLDDDPINLEILRGYTRDTLITTEWRVWEPNFVEVNYSVRDLALVALQHAEPLVGKSREPFLLTGEEIEQSLQAHNAQVAESGKGRNWTLEFALGVVLGRDKGRSLAKGTELGSALAEWTFATDSPAVTSDADKKRPIIALFDSLLGATSSSYHMSVRRQVIGEDGHRCPPSC